MIQLQELEIIKCDKQMNGWMQGQTELKVKLVGPMKDMLKFVQFKYPKIGTTFFHYSMLC